MSPLHPLRYLEVAASKVGRCRLRARLLICFQRVCSAPQVVLPRWNPQPLGDLEVMLRGFLMSYHTANPHSK